MIKDYRLVESYPLTAEQCAHSIEVNTATFEKQGATWLANTKANKQNADENPQFLSKLYTENRSGAALLVGAGPSLYENLDKVAQLSCYNIVVDRVFANCPIKPDLVVCQDAHTVVKYFLNDIKEGDKVAIAVTTHPSLYKSLQKKGADIYWFGNINPFNPLMRHVQDIWGEDSVCVMEGGTVGYSTADIAARMGFETACLIGHDLCYRTLDDAIKSGNFWGGIQKIPNGQYTIPAFLLAACAMNALPLLYPDTRFVDFSRGLITDMVSSDIEKWLSEQPNKN